MQTLVKFILSFILAVLSRVSYELRNLFSTFGGVRNGFCRTIFNIVAQKSVICMGY